MMFKPMRSIAAAGVALTFSAGVAFAEEEHAHLDFSPTLENGQVISNGWDDAALSDNFHPDVRVFGLEFGETPGDPYFAGDPGFNVRPGSGFAQGSQMGYRLLDTLGYWDGSDVNNIAFTAPTAGTTITISFGSSNRTLSDASFNDTDAFIGPAIDELGSTHFHLNTVVAGPGGGNPANGIYLIEMALLNSGGAAVSEPVFVLFNLGIDEELHEAAVEWAEANLVPEPASMALVGIGATLIAARRKRG